MINLSKSIIDNVVYIHLQTTGFDPYNNEIIQINAIKVKENSIFTFSTLIKPVKEIPQYIMNSVTNISVEDLKKAPLLEEVEKKFMEFASGLPVISNNLKVEGSFLMSKFKRFPNKLLDLMELTAILEPWRKEYKIETLIDEITEIKSEEFTKGIDYCKFMIIILNSLLCRQWDREDQSKKKKNLYNILVSQYNLLNRWGWTKYLERPLFFSAEEYPYVVYENDKKNKSVNENMKIPYGKYEELLKDTRIWNSDEDFNYEYREDQYLFSKKIRENIEKDEKIFIEAPTGSGKTFAYVLIAALKAYINKGKNKIEDASFIISTDTKELQNQLIHKDIPEILDKLKLNNKIKYGSIKGKNNYICVDKLIKTQCFDGNLMSILAEIFFKRLCADGKHGDIENINYWAYNHFGLDEYIKEICSENEECKIEKCHRKCYLKKRYNELPLENITVINHSLLANWPYSEKKKITHLIIDEAHNLMDKCYDFFSEEFDSNLLLEDLKSLWEKEPTIYRQMVSLNFECGFKETIELDNMKYWAKEIQTAVAILLNKTVELKLGGGEYNFKSEFYLSSYEYKQKLNLLVPYISGIKERIYGLFSLLNRYFKNMTEDEKDVSDSKEYVNVYNYITKFKNAFEVMDRFLEVPEKIDKFAKIIEIDKDYNFFKVTNVPLNIDELVNEKILKDVKSTTFLSATLRINNSFSKIKKILGQKDSKEYVVKSTFDLRRQTKIFLVSDIGRYNMDSFCRNSARFIFEMAKKLKGHIMVLFTNNNRRKRVELELFDLVKGTQIEIHTNKKSIAYLKDKNKQVIILGTKGFFEGIDIPGDALTCVMIDKIPNKSLEDPLLKAITTYKNNSYVDVNYPQVCIKMKQVYGRLIRSIMDYGYFCVLDSGENSNLLNRLERDLNGPVFIRKSMKYIIEKSSYDYRRWQLDNLKVIKEDIEKNDFYIENFNKKAKRKKSFWYCKSNINGNGCYENLDFTVTFREN